MTVHGLHTHEKDQTQHALCDVFIQEILTNTIFSPVLHFNVIRLSVCSLCSDFKVIIITINPLTARVVGEPQIISQTVFSIFPCSPLPSATCPTQGLSVP